MSYLKESRLKGLSSTSGDWFNLVLFSYSLFWIIWAFESLPSLLDSLFSSP